jgi:hypothetical protein
MGILTQTMLKSHTCQQISVVITLKSQRKRMKHSKHFYYPEIKNERINARADAALGFLTALAIGVGLAVLLVVWWSA